MKYFPQPSAMLFVVVMASVTFGCGRTGDDLEDDRAAEPTPVRAVPVKMTTLHPFIDLVGVLATVPEQTVVLSTQVQGQIEQVCVQEGQQVHAGDEIIVLDDRMAQAALAKAAADLAESESALALLRQGPHIREVETARQQVLNAEAAARTRREKVDALVPLHEKHEVSDVRFEQVKAEMESAEAEKEAAVARLRLLEAGARPEKIAEAEAKVASAEAEVGTQKLTVELCRITSPIDGVLAELPVRQGMFVAPPTTVATIMDLTTLFAQVRIPAAYLSQVRVGAAADVAVPSSPNQGLPGVIARIGKKADPQTGDVNAFASVPNSGGELGPGLACRVSVALPDVPDAVVVPVSAVADRDGIAVVTVVQDNKAYEKEVRLGVQTRDFAQIIEGVSPGDLVAIEGGYGLPEGCPVRLLAEPAGLEQQEQDVANSG